MATIEEKFAFESSDVRFENITRSDLKIAAEIFVYLKACPEPGNLKTDDSMQTWYTSWSSFFEDLFNTHSIGKIILTLNRIMKTDGSEDGKVRCQKLLKRVANYSSLKYEEIQSILAGHTSVNLVSGNKKLQEIKNLEGVYFYEFRIISTHNNSYL